MFDTQIWLHICSFVPIQHRVLTSVIQALEDGHKMLRHLTVVHVISQLVSWNQIVRLFEINEHSV